MFYPSWRLVGAVCTCDILSSNLAQNLWEKMGKKEEKKVIYLFFSILSKLPLTQVEEKVLKC